MNFYAVLNLDLVKHRFISHFI